MENAWIKKPITILTILVSISILGLVVIQASWLNKAIEIRQKELTTQINKVLYSISFSQPDFLDKLNEQKGVSNSTIQNGGSLHEKIINAIDSIFLSNGINSELEFGIYEYGKSDILLISDSTFKKDILSSTIQSCLTCYESKIVMSHNGNGTPVPDTVFVKQGLQEYAKAPKIDKGAYLIGVVFREKHLFYLPELKSQVILAGLLLVLLIGSYLIILRMNLRQKKMSEIKDDFINNLTHELKTPIASIQLSTKVLEKSRTSKLSSHDRSFLKLIENEGKRLESNIDKALQIAMVDSGNFSLELSWLNLHDTLHQVLKSLGVFINQTGAIITTSFSSKDIFVHADETHLFNLFYNLVENSLKYSKATPKIVLTTETRNEKVLVSVEDNGLGMSYEVQRNVFKKFYRGQNRNTYISKGFGLGLNYVKNITELHGGSIKFKSQLGIGTKFTIIMNYKKHA